MFDRYPVYPSSGSYRYKFLDKIYYLLIEQKGFKKKSHGTKDQLMIDMTIPKDGKRKHRNLTMAWVHYKEAYKIFPHSWTIESLKLS